MKLKHFLPIFFIVILFVCSCTSYKNVPYFQDLKRDSVLTEKINNFTPLIIQSGDLLAIHVTSMSHEADAIFNYNLERPNGLSASSTESAEALGGSSGESAVFGYLVDLDGNIRLPMIGSVKVAGLNTTEITSMLESSLSQVLNKPVVDVRIENFKISILGDVKNPGSYSIPDERVTITEAMAIAGDLNTTGIRTNVLLIREINGERKYVTLDLTSKNIFASPYFYLKNNDVIYVQPNKEKVADNGTAFQKVSIALAVLSIIVYLIHK